MKNEKLLLGTVALAALVASAPANAADLPVAPAYKAPALAAPLVYNWTGFYIGANVGWGRAREDNTDNLDGIIGGGQIGVNWQTGNFVFGAESDIQWSDQKKTFTFPGGTETDRVRWFGTSRLRAGVTFDRMLFYVTGGLAYGEAKADATLGPLTASISQTKAGWTAGGGIEAALVDNWSVKAEYLHIDYGSLTFGGIILPTKLTDDVVRLGINYRFGWGGPVVARY